ncbi:MAG: phytoene/squalene synthase family protein [Cyanobacteria bacterium P01_H01_bin.15]
MNCCDSALDILKRTSRTFFIPIARLPQGLQEAVAGAYLCMRAIDEIEDHPHLANPDKARLLRLISLNLQAGTELATVSTFSDRLETTARELGFLDPLPEVSLRIGEWALLPPKEIAPRVWDATAAMADRMAYWSEVNWQIESESDLDRYTFSVAGAVGLLLSELWAWFDGTQTSRQDAIGFGRGLQAVNILRNHQEDFHRGVSFFPPGWQVTDLDAYARRNLALADSYVKSLKGGPALDFCQIPLTLAYGTLDVMSLGRGKLSRNEVIALLQRVTG